jgi:hypothetical protein
MAGIGQDRNVSGLDLDIILCEDKLLYIREGKGLSD